MAELNKRIFNSAFLFIPTNSLEMLGRKFVGKTMVIGVISIARRRGKPW